MTVEFFLTSLIVVLLPGTGVIYTVATGLAQGGKASISAAAGCTLGIVPHLCACIFGVAAILHTSAVAFQVFKLIGVAYLAYLAWAMWKESGTLSFETRDNDTAYTKIALRGFLINILNPKLSIFFLAFLPQFVPESTTTALPTLLSLSSVFMLMTFIVFVGYGILANRVRHLVAHLPRIIRNMQKVFAGSFVALGAKLAFAER